jgi:hypothetical protein
MDEISTGPFRPPESLGNERRVATTADPLLDLDQLAADLDDADALRINQVS